MSWPALLRVAGVCVAAIVLGLAISTLSATGQSAAPIVRQASPSAEAAASTATPAEVSPASEPTAAATATAARTATAAATATAARTATAAATVTREPTAAATATAAATVAPATAAPATAVTNAASAFEEYTVQRGDTLKGIAEAYGVTVQALLAANTIPNPDALTIGAVLRIPPRQ